MSKIHYFQRYSSKENWMTNSTLLLLSRLYHFNRLKFEKTINAILEENNLSLNIGVEFTQQTRELNSVIDGSISQNSFKIVIETKLYDNFNHDQLVRHLDSLQVHNHNERILLALSKNKTSWNDKSKITEVLKSDKYKGIRFASTTFEDVYRTILDNLSDQDLEMKEILADYLLLCKEHGLTNIDDKTMLVFTVNKSLNENLRYGIYYDPITRNHNQPFRYIGLYQNKKIVAVGRVVKKVSCNYINDELIISETDNPSELTTQEKDRIKGIIRNTNYYDLKEGIRFFLVDEFHETNYIKKSNFPIRTKKYILLDESINGFEVGISSKELAKLLVGMEW